MGLYTPGKAIEVPFTDFGPDLPRDSKGILLDAQNAYPTVAGYAAFNQPLPHIYGALPETPIGSTVGNYSDGSIMHFAGGLKHLYAVQGIMDDPSSKWVVADGLGLGQFNAAKWRFAQYNDDMIAVGGNSVVPQVATGSHGAFSALGGGPPVGASIVAAVNSQVLMFRGNTWYASAIGADNVWTPSTQVQAGFAPITDLPGNITAAQVLFRQVVVFKNVGIWLMSYVGGDAIWSVQPISTNNGSWSQESTCLIPDGVAFFGLDDFYICSGYTPQRIPNNFKEWFFDTADPAQFPNMQSRYDPYHAIIYWHFVSKNPPTPGVPDRFVAYNVRAQRWAPGYLNTPNVPVPNFHFSSTTDISGFYFDTSNVLKTFRGLAGPMRLLTGYVGVSGKITQLLRVRPKYNIYPATDQMQTFHVNSLAQSDIAAPAAAIGADQWFNVRQSDRYHRVQLEATGSLVPGQENLGAGAECCGFSFEFRETGDR
jgi:hypothetical protein